MLAAYRRGELELTADDLKPPQPKGAPRRKKVKDAPVVVQKESLASRLAAKSRTLDTNDSVIKRRLKAKRERDAQAQVAVAASKDLQLVRLETSTANWCCYPAGRRAGERLQSKLH